MILTCFTFIRIYTLFETVNETLGYVGQWFRGNKLPLNIKILNVHFFHKNSIQDNTPLKLPQLNIFNKPFQKANSIKMFRHVFR